MHGIVLSLRYSVCSQWPVLLRFWQSAERNVDEDAQSVENETMPSLNANERVESGHVN